MSSEKGFNIKKSLGFNALATPPANPSTGEIYLSTDGNLYQFSSGAWRKLAGGATAFDVAQTAHAFPVLTAIYHNGTTWVAARADDQDTLSTHIVVEVIDANNFVAANFGKYTVPLHGKTVGQYYFLSAVTAGASSTAEPASPDFSCPLYYVQDADTIHALVYRPSKVDADGYLGANKYDTVTTAGQIYFDLGFWVNLDAKNSFDFYYDGVLLKEGVGFDYTLTNVVNNHSNQVTLAVAATVGKNVQAVYRGIYEQIDSMPNPMTSVGDLIRGGTSGTPTRLGIGALGSLLRSNGTNPAWDSSIYVAADGKVGIGTSSPLSKTNIADNSSNLPLMIKGGSAGIANDGGGIAFSTNNGSTITSASQAASAIRSLNSYGSETNGEEASLAFYTNKRTGTNTYTGLVERMRIDSSGNVGISATSPSTFNPNSTLNRTLTMQYSDQAITLRSYYEPAVNQFSLIRSSNGANTGISELQYEAFIHKFLSGTGTSGTERMRIDSSGNVLVGQANLSPITVRVNGWAIKPGGSTEIRGAGDVLSLGCATTSATNIRFYTDNGSAYVTGGNISTNGITTSYNATSDYRAKENISPLNSVLSDIMQLNPVEFDWKVEFAGTIPHTTGFIAHELQAIYPKCVTGEKDAVKDDGTPLYQSIDVGKLMPEVVKAIQELNAKLDAKSALVESLQTELSDKSSQIESLQTDMATLVMRLEALEQA